MNVTIETILEGLESHDEWVYRAVTVLADHSKVSFADRRRLRELREEVKIFQRTGYSDSTTVGEARSMSKKYAHLLLEKATTPSFQFHGKTFVMTGKLDSYTRPQLTKKLQELGAFVSTSVTRTTDVVVCGKKAGVKLTRAKQYGCTIWDEKELLRNLASPASKI